MKKTLAFASIILFLTCNISFAQPEETEYENAKAFLEASVAMNGGDAWGTIETIKTKGSVSMETPMGMMDGSYIQSSKYPGFSHQLMSFGSAMGLIDVDVVIRPNGGWVDVSVQGRAQTLPPEAAEMLVSASYETALLSKADETLMLAADSLDGQSFITITYTRPTDKDGDGVDETEAYTATSFYDRTTLRRAAMKASSAQGESLTKYSDFRAVEDVWFPFVQKTTGVQRIDITLDEVTLNPVIDETIFEDN